MKLQRQAAADQWAGTAKESAVHLGRTNPAQGKRRRERGLLRMGGNQAQLLPIRSLVPMTTNLKSETRMMFFQKRWDEK